jgi:hypothetical protein
LSIYVINNHTEDISVAYILYVISDIYLSVGFVKRASVFCERSLSMYENKLGHKNLNTAAAFDQLGFIRCLQFNFTDAKHFTDRAINIYANILDCNDPRMNRSRLRARRLNSLFGIIITIILNNCVFVVWFLLRRLLSAKELRYLREFKPTLYHELEKTKR